ncbi:MAG: class I SAM-dependent methyltransferase [Burkholderiales bacterium]|nr:class I SAM-dependent methyltransferase [Burkholderiales bacterium]
MNALTLPRLPWPLPALLAWLTGWALFLALRGLPGAAPLAPLLATLAAALWAWPAQSTWRRLIVAGGFPLSALGSGLATGMPAWAWLLPLALLALTYPLRAWGDAPLFPTPIDALADLPRHARLPGQGQGEGACVLDAGCGLGHGLRALQRAWPAAHVEGIEWSWPLRLAAGWRCRFARVRQGDMWRHDWSGYDLVYLFQRPESMRRALAKAERQMAPGTWLASLAFEVPGARPHAVLKRQGAHTVWVYRIGENADLGSMPGRSGR